MTLKEYKKYRKEQRKTERRKKFKQWWLCRNKHTWQHNEHNSAKRTCTKCNRHEWMFERKFPSFDEPSLFWKEIS